jgi:hypothetical protein
MVLKGVKINPGQQEACYRPIGPDAGCCIGKYLFWIIIPD